MMVLLVSFAAGQDVTVYSEFTRIDPFGQPVRADRGSKPPREILSPAIARNAFASFHVVVSGRSGDSFTLQIAQNPDDAVHVTVYRERYVQVGNEWIPDALEPVKLPLESRIGEGGVPSQTAQAFWLDVFPDREAPVRRIKVEPQVNIGDGWLRYPMEVRVTEAALGSDSQKRRASGAEDVSQSSASSAFAVWSAALCGSAEKKNSEPALSIRNFIARNALQDWRSAGGVPPPPLLHLAGAPDRSSFCKTAKLSGVGAEDYLLVRDALIGARE
jgi:hypothetical protein